jgi:hypothetical protein
MDRLPDILWVLSNVDPAPTPHAPELGAIHNFQRAWAASEVASLLGLLSTLSMAAPNGGVCGVGKYKWPVPTLRYPREASEPLIDKTRDSTIRVAAAR